MGKNQLPQREQRKRHAKIVELRKAGDSYAEITAKTGVSDRTISRVLSEAGLVDHDTAPPRPHPQELWDAIEKFLREEEAPYAAAAQVFGVSQKQIANKFPDLGWTRSQAGRHQGQVNGIMWRNRKSEAVKMLKAS